MQFTSYGLDLCDLMDSRYSAGGWTQRIGVGVGTDIGPAIADGVANLRVLPGGRGKILIPPGTWLMTTSPGDLSGVYLEGMGSMASVIAYNNTVGGALPWRGSNGFTGGGARGIGLLLESGLGNTNAYGILLQGTATYQPDQMEFNDIYMSAIGGNSYWWDCFHADGSARAHPQGVRVATLNNVQLFNAHNIGFYGANLVQWTLNNVGCYTGTGPYGTSVIITGGSVHVYGQAVNAQLNITSTNDVSINGTRYS